MESFYFDFFYFSKSFLWSNQFTNIPFFNHFFWNTIWMTPTKDLDEVMKIDLGVALIWIGLGVENVFRLSLVIDGMKEMMGASKICPLCESLGWS